MTIIESLAIFYFLSCIGCGLVLMYLFRDEEMRIKHRGQIWLIAIPILNFIVVGMFLAAFVVGLIWNIKTAIRKYLYVKYWTFILNEHIKFCIICIYSEGEEKFRDEQVEKMEQIIKIAKS